MAKKTQTEKHPPIVFVDDPLECPFREFRDSELIPDLWGLGPAGYRAFIMSSSVKSAPAKSHTEQVWVDEQTQPLPRSVRNYLHGWVRAEELATSRWEAELVVCEEEANSKMSVFGTQLSHAQVLHRSGFARRVMSACYMLERMEAFPVEHVWENFNCTFGTEGWRAKYHIYSPGLKPGGGPAHKPTINRLGCYLVRLFYLGAWRCVWVSDRVPVDTSGAPLLPFSPTYTAPVPPPPTRSKQSAAPPPPPPMVVQMWPLLLCKALLKLAAPDMNFDETNATTEDEPMEDFDIIHALTGCVNIIYKKERGSDELWNTIRSEVPMFVWEDDEDTAPSTAKSKSPKKVTAKDIVVKKTSATSILITDTGRMQPFTLPGITPCHDTRLLVKMARDLPLKKPLPEPEVPLWKTYRWVPWARHHGLYDDYDCPRTKYVKVSGLLKLSYAPQLLGIESTESITAKFVKDIKDDGSKGKKSKEKDPKPDVNAAMQKEIKEELREWVLYDHMIEFVDSISVLHFPSMYNYTSAASSPPLRITKSAPNKALDMTAPKYSPLYLQIDGPETMNLKISFSVLHPRVLCNCGVIIDDNIERAYLFLEEFEWFKDTVIPKAKAFVNTRAWVSTEVDFPPGRHVCRLWVHSRLHWHVMLISHSQLLLGPRNVIEAAAVKECPWASIFLTNLGAAFMNWVRTLRSAPNFKVMQNEFYRSYECDLQWDPVVVGYDKAFVHWMFRKALHLHLRQKLMGPDFQAVCALLRYAFSDPEFGLPTKFPPPYSLREIALRDPCDCTLPEEVKGEGEEEQLEQQKTEESEDVSLVGNETMAILLKAPKYPVTSNVCELATDDLPCGVLKQERDKVIHKHETATFLQAHWRGYWARKCLKTPVTATVEVQKLLMESTFGNMEHLSQFMNQFFILFPGAKSAYSVASALCGSYGLKQHLGTTRATAKCKWVPFFQGIFFCHAPVKVHFDLNSSMAFNTLCIYDNDSRKQVPQVYNAQITFDFVPNTTGYSVLGSGTLKEAAGVNTDVQWMLTVLSSIDGVFHTCDGASSAQCIEHPIVSTTKLHVNEMFLPNRRNILGGIQLNVVRDETVRFRAEAVTPELEMIAILKTKDHLGNTIELGRCSGVGELYWPYIRLKYVVPEPSCVGLQTSVRTLEERRGSKLKQVGRPASARRSRVKLLQEPQIFTIEVVTPNGWPLSMEQWLRVEEARKAYENSFTSGPAALKAKSVVKEKTSARDKSRPEEVQETELNPDDAYVELECSFTSNMGAFAKRDDERDMEFAAALKEWDLNEPGRNARGAVLRQEFRLQYLEADASVGSVRSYGEEFIEEEKLEDPKSATKQGPTPLSESNVGEGMVEAEEEQRYLMMPEQLKDKFIPLDYLDICTKERTSYNVVLTKDMVEAAKKDRFARLESAWKRMADLQLFNELKVLGHQRNRCKMIENLFIDSTWKPEIIDAFESRNEAVNQEVLARTLSATKKKAELAASSKKK